MRGGVLKNFHFLNRTHPETENRTNPEHRFSIFFDRTNPETEQTPNIDFRFLIILLCKPNRTRRKINRNIFHFVLTNGQHCIIFSI